MRNPNSNWRGAPTAYVPDWKFARNGVVLDEVTPPITLEASGVVPQFPLTTQVEVDGVRTPLGKLPGRNVLTRLNTLKMLALGSMVTRSLILIGQDAFKSINFSQGIPTALGTTEPRAGITQPRALMSVGVITCVPAMSPGHTRLLPTRQSPAGVRFPE